MKTTIITLFYRKMEEYDALAAENERLRDQFEHIKLWCSQSHHGLTVQQIADAIINMCNDAAIEAAQENNDV